MGFMHDITKEESVGLGVVGGLLKNAEHILEKLSPFCQFLFS